MRIIFGIIILISLLNFIDGDYTKRRSNALFNKRLLNLLLEVKRRGLLYNSDELEQQQVRRNIFNIDDDFELTHARRKAVGLGDDPI